MPDNEGAIVMMTFLQPPSFADSPFDEQTALIDEELAALKQILETSPT
ncbi:MAG: hypothetical protein ACXWZI_02600 [Mycobacterium sp.]